MEKDEALCQFYNESEDMIGMIRTWKTEVKLVLRALELYELGVRAKDIE